MSTTPPKDTVDSVLEKLNKPVKTEETPVSSKNNSTSILGEGQSVDDLLIILGIEKKK